MIVKCKVCEGTGKTFQQYYGAFFSKNEPCKACKGRGEIIVPSENIDKCKVCDGKGYYAEQLSLDNERSICSACNGAGVMTRLCEPDTSKKRESIALDPFGPIASLLFELDSDEVQRIIGLSGLIIDWSLTKQQDFSSKTRNRVYIGRVTKAFASLSAEQKERLIIAVAREVINVNAVAKERLRSYLQHIGWDIIDDRLIKIDVVNPSDLLNLPKIASDDLIKAAERLPDDCSGAISAACGSIDSICKGIYKKYKLGNVNESSFQERVEKSLKAINALAKLHAGLIRIGWEERDAKIFNENLKKAITHAAYVMQTLRSKMGDVHGSKPYIDMLAFDSIKWAMIIASLLREPE